MNVLDPNDIYSLERIKGLKNDIDVELAWTSSPRLLGPNTNEIQMDNPSFNDTEGTIATIKGKINFIITLINNQTVTNQEHIDYEFTIYNDSSGVLFNQGSHSTYGVEVAKFKLEKPGS